ncbi:acylphosphatase [Breoghania sp.]|uniref:acylphosphatase n=1 Tax=Breoghania sp. TaxID=2065378 RepID=UPI002AA92B03|nr:acylphosphatase [Breoghania sp.]
MTEDRGPDETALQVLISGRVQGVGYRAWCEETATSLGLSGWVRNLRSGEVEAVFSGEARAVKAMVAQCGEGPKWGWVRNVKIVREVAPLAGPFKVKASV